MIIYNVGARPGKGRYTCINCRWTVKLDDEADRLPPCGRCPRGHVTKYIRVG